MLPELPVPSQEERAQEKNMEVEGWDGTKFVPRGFVVSDKRAEGVWACCGGGVEPV